MGLIKCPRCELNYMLDTDKLCSVCRREVRGESESDEVVELCSECGENPVVPGQELCAACLKERAAAASGDEPSDEEMANATNIGIDDVSSMNELQFDLDAKDVDEDKNFSGNKDFAENEDFAEDEDPKQDSDETEDEEDE